MFRNRLRIYQTALSICILVLILTIIPTGLTSARPPTQTEPPDDDPPGPVFNDDIVPIPEPLPEWTPPRNIPGSVNQIVVYDASTGQEIYLPLSSADRAETGQTAPYHPDFLDVIPDLSRGFGSLTEVTNYSSWPYTPIVRLFDQYPDGGWRGCSGVLIDSNHVLTAAHCVYTFDSSRCNPGESSCWATDNYVYSGYHSQEYEVASERTSTGLWTYTAWINDQNYDFDIAMIELKYPIGGWAGWYGYGYNNTDSYFTGNTFTSTGFPGESPYDGQIMYTWSGTFDETEVEQLKHNEYSYGGQSGSGVYNSVNTIYGVLSHGTADPGYPDPYTAHTRITSSKYSDIGSYISSTTPSSFDLAIYNVQAGPETLDRGDQLTSLEYSVFNVSSVAHSSETYTVNLYLSSNNLITAGDIFLQTRYGTWSFDPKSGTHIISTSNLPTIPGDMCVSNVDGEWWYIGAILDYSDVNSANNFTDKFQPKLIWINACDDYEHDDTPGTASVLYPAYDFQLKDIIPADDQDWVRFTITEESDLELRTSGSAGNNTILYLYNSGLSQIDYNDDIEPGNYYSMITRSCGVDPLPAGTYYAKVIEYDQDNKIEGYYIQLATETCSASEDHTNYVPLFLKE